MTPLEQLDAAWAWYQAARHSLRRLRRIAEKYWDALPWEGEAQMGRDNVVGKLESEQVLVDAKNAESRMDELAVIELFSIFEGIVRTHAVKQLGEASVGLKHPLLIAAAEDAIEAAEKRSFAQVLNSYSQGGHADLAEQLRRVRHYRNWLTHGRKKGKKEEPRIDPMTAYQRLRKFLEIVLLPPKPDAEAKPPENTIERPILLG
jgi:hypothetical protein